jgi:hypothetical protein
MSKGLFSAKIRTRDLWLCLIEFGESGGSRSIDFPGEDLQKRETIIDSLMTIVEVARLPDQVVGHTLEHARPHYQ